MVAPWDTTAMSSRPFVISMTASMAPATRSMASIWVSPPGGATSTGLMDQRSYSAGYCSFISSQAVSYTHLDVYKRQLSE